MARSIDCGFSALNSTIFASSLPLCGMSSNTTNARTEKLNLDARCIKIYKVYALRNIRSGGLRRSGLRRRYGKGCIAGSCGRKYLPKWAFGCLTCNINHALNFTSIWLVPSKSKCYYCRCKKYLVKKIQFVGTWP